MQAGNRPGCCERGGLCRREVCAPLAVLAAFWPAAKVHFPRALSLAYVRRADCLLAFASMSGNAAFELPGLRNSVFTLALLEQTEEHGIEKVGTLLSDFVQPRVATLWEEAKAAAAAVGAPLPAPQVPWSTACMGPTPRRIVQLGRCIALEAAHPDITVGSLVTPLLQRFQGQVRAPFLSDSFIFPYGSVM
jgi:hypothetical protein